MRFVISLVTLTCLTCGSEVSANPNPFSFFSSDDPDKIRGDGSPLFKQAQQFDRLIRQQLSEQEKKNLARQCQKAPLKNPFCSGFYQRRKFLKIVQDKSKRPEAPIPKEIVPLSPLFRDKKVLNLSQLRKAKIDSLLKGLSSLKEPELMILAEEVLKNRFCPNRIAVALAATLEDYLPDKPFENKIADLYLKGAACAKREPTDRENYLTRAGLFFIWKKNYKQAIQTLSRVRPTDAFSGRALYWLAKAYALSGNKLKAELTFTRLQAKQPLSFHSLLASEDLKSDPLLSWIHKGTIKKARSKRIKPANSFIKQAEILKQFGFDFSASVMSEFTFSRYKRLEGEVRIYLASLSDPPTAIIQLPFVLISEPRLANREVMELLYPRPFLPLFEKNSSGIDPYLLLSIARKESRFNPLAVSWANAQGLMQINPDTAKKMSGHSMSDLFDPNVGVGLAARHLQEDLSRFDNHLPHAIAAYNAGDAAVSRWITRYPTSDPILFLDLIPYRETRDYTAFVLSNYVWYRKLYAKGYPTKIPLVLGRD